MLWVLAQTLWLGAHLGFLFVFVPALEKSGLAPLLQAEIRQIVRPGLMAVTLLAGSVQLLVLWRSLPVSRWLQDLRSQLLLVILLSAASFLAASYFVELSSQWVAIGNGLLLGCGLVLLTQPLPAQER